MSRLSLRFLLLFIFLYIAGTFFLWYLKDPLKIIAVIIFGAYLSTFFIYIAEIANAYIFFKISRAGGGVFFEKKLKGRPKKIYEKNRPNEYKLGIYTPGGAAGALPGPGFRLWPKQYALAPVFTCGCFGFPAADILDSVYTGVDARFFFGCSFPLEEET